MKNLKTRGEYLFEKHNYSLITEAGIQSNNAKWSETMIGKLFNFVFKVITLNGFLVDKFKDIFGAKSFILKSLSRRLEKAIDALPGEYVERNSEIEFQDIEMSYYTVLLNIIEILEKSEDYVLIKLSIIVEDSLKELIELKSKLDVKDKKHSLLIREIENSIKDINKLIEKIKSVIKNIPSDEVEDKKGFNFKENLKDIGDKSDIKKKLGKVQYLLKNRIKDSKDNASISTKSMFKIVSIMNKARDTYMEADQEGETIYKSNKRETIFKPNERLFSVWEDKVMKILQRKNDIIPKKLSAYINSSLASIDPDKYKIDIGEREARNILDELSDVDRALEKVEKAKSSKTPVDVMDKEKSIATSFHFKTNSRLIITKDLLLNSLLEFKIDSGNAILLNPQKDDTEVESIDKSKVYFVPTRTYVNGMSVGIFSFNPEVFNGAKTSANNTFDVSEQSFDESDFWKSGPHYYWAVLNKKDIELGKNYIIRIFNPGHTITPDRLEKMDNETLYEQIVISDLDGIRTLYGNDDKIVALREKYLVDKFNFKSTGYKSVVQYFNSNKF